MRLVMRRFGSVAVLTAGAVVLSAGGAFAHECTNASRNANNPEAGVQLVIDASNDEIVWVSRGLQNRIDRGLVDPASGEGFHGLVGLDLDGDGAADLSTWIVGPNDEVPLNAQLNGAACRGVVNIGDYFACLAG
jgi:hypothetical protein